ncbi:MAG: DUF882 domain-containing protein [Gemmatimonadaceae bacterium]|nr:DUF882 domain-containing protein [Gemmatimonadaceae bacterium]
MRTDHSSTSTSAETRPDGVGRKPTQIGLIGLTHADPVHDDNRPLQAAPPGNDRRRVAKLAALVLVPCAIAFAVHRGSEPEGLEMAEARASGFGPAPVSGAPGTALPAGQGLPRRAFAAGSFGHSNAVRIRTSLPGELIAMPLSFAGETDGVQSQWISFDGKPNDGVVPWRQDGAVRTPTRPGAYWLVLSRGGASDTVADLALFVEVPMPNKMATGINGYHLGRWPKAAENIVPPGFIEVNQRIADFPLSPHLKMSDFVVHDAQEGFPKYLHVRGRLLDKLELTIAEIAQMRGRPVSALTLHVASGFRSPAHNGGLSGSAQDSRHMYGDAADIAIDANSDGALSEIDARLVAAAAEAVERKYPDLVGGIGLYITPDGGGWPYVHIDTRGVRARWRGGARRGAPVDSLPADATFDSVPVVVPPVAAVPARTDSAGRPAGGLPAGTPPAQRVPASTDPKGVAPPSGAATQPTPVAAATPAATPASTPAAPAARRKGASPTGAVRSGSAAARNGRRKPSASPRPAADDPFSSAARRFRATRP